MSEDFLFVHVNEWAPFRSPDTIPISSAYILSSLKKLGFSGEILGDFKDRPLTPGLFAETLKTHHPPAIGFSTYAENINRIRFWARLAKRLQPEVVTIIGGPQVSAMPKEALAQMNEIDLLCRGEGELVMADLAKTLCNCGQTDTVPGLCLLHDGVPAETPAAPHLQELDSIPSPYLDDTLDVSSKERAIMFTSRGCTSNCSFCYTPRASNYKLLLHSVDRVIEEMRYLKHKGIEDFWFADPNFASSKKRVEELCRAIIKYVPNIRFWCQARYQELDKNLIQLLKIAGAETIAFGLESSSPVTLKTINKPVRPEALSWAISQCREQDINVELFTLFGLPGDTFDSSLETLEFVRNCGIPIEGNSISQQLHLFFGTPMASNPKKWNIDCTQITRPAYLSVDRDFSTGDMSCQEIEKMSLLWRLHRSDFTEHVELGHDLFGVAGFISRNYSKLADSPMADILLSRIYFKLDEQLAAADCLSRLRKHWPDNAEALAETNKPLIGYKGGRRLCARQHSKVIFDCKALSAGKVIPETEMFYQIAIIGSGDFLPQFEEGLLGVKAGSGIQFDLTFPEDYGNQDLAGKTVAFQVYLHKVMEPVFYEDLDDMISRPVKNMYRFDDLIGLKKHNETLYYMVLRDSVLHSYAGNLTDMIALFDYYLKLGFFNKALDLAHTINQEPSVYGHIGTILQINGYARDALDFLQPVKGTSAEVENQRIRAFMQLNKYDRAEEIAKNPLLSTNLETLNLKVKLASKGNLPVNRYLQRMDSLLDVQVKLAAASV